MIYKENIKPVLVSKEAAITLRELGFNEWCDNYYHVEEQDEDNPDSYEMGWYQKCNENFPDEYGRVAAPYVMDALLWMHYRLNTNFNLITFTYDKAKQKCVIIKNDKDGQHKKLVSFDTDIQQAIRECIDLYFGIGVSEK